MSRYPRNVRRQIGEGREPTDRPAARASGGPAAPRPVRIALPAPTPTPPPVAVSLAEPAPPRNERLSQDVLLPRPREQRGALAWLALSLAIAALAALVVLRSVEGSPLASRAGALVAQAGAVAAALTLPVAEAAPPPPVAPSLEPAGPAADAHVNRNGYSSIHNGACVVFMPKTFSSADGTYDLFLHFHGGTKIVLESAEHAGLDAVVAVVNLGTGSAPYEEAYAAPGSYELLLTDIERAVQNRGLETPHLRRVALASWSAGYGAIGTILEQRKGKDPLDAVLVLDGIHTGFVGGDPSVLNAMNLAPFLQAARTAAEGQLFFSITHSDVEPIGYASTSATSSLLLDAVRATRELADPASAPEHVQLAAAEGAVSRKLEKHMEPETEARLGGFHVRGYRGNTPEHHMAHLLQMAATVLPELAARWK